MKNRLFILLIALIILTSAFVFPSTVSAAEAVYDVEGWVPEVGDIDGDGKVATLKDLMVLARYLDNWAGYEDMIYVKAADLNGDGLYATLADMYYLERYLAKWSGYTFGVSTDDDAEETTTEGTTLPIYARLDFGTASKAQDLNYTTHDWLVSALTYNQDNLKVEFTDDTIIVTAQRDHGHSTAIDEEWGEYLVSDRYGFSLCFDDLVCYDFDNFLMPGYGSWANAPYVQPNETTRWVGQHQYMQVRMRNFTNNNIISVAFSKQIGSYATTQIVGGLYLQGGEPATADKTGKTASIDTSWKVYTYDMNFSAHVTRNLSGSYAQMVESVINIPHGCGTNNWHWFGNARNEIIGLRFAFLGGISRTNYMYYQADYYQIDTREFVTKGDRVEVDYVIFGSSIEQLDEYRSYAEESSLNGYVPEYPESGETTAKPMPEETTAATSYIEPEVTMTATSNTVPAETTAAPETPEIVAPTVVVDKVSANADDDQVAVNISLHNNPGLTAMKMYVYYGDGLSLNNITFNSDFGAYVTAPQPFTNPQGITFMSALVEVAVDGVFATLTFDIADDVKQGSVINVDVVLDQENTYDEDFNDVEFDVINGHVGIKYIK